MRDLVRAGVGDRAVLFTTDGAGVNYLKCGKIPDVYATVDFGSGKVERGRSVGEGVEMYRNGFRCNVIGLKRC